MDCALVPMLTMSGRSLAILPREVDPNGYKDLNVDDYDGRDDIKWLQHITNHSNHRSSISADKQ